MADIWEMGVLLLHKSSDVETIEQILIICKALGVHPVLYPYESPWRETLFRTLSENSIIIAVVDKDFFKFASSVFVSGYILGRRMPVILYKKKPYILPDFFTDVPVTGDIRFLANLLRRELEKSYVREQHKEAEKALKEMDFPFTFSAFIQTVKEGESLAVEQFLKGGFSANLEDENGVPLLCHAVRNQHRRIITLLLSHGVDINSISMDRGNTALMDASAMKDSDTVELLIKAGAELDIKSKSGQTALILAVGRKDEKIAKILIDAGASVTETDSLGMSAEKYARLFKLSRIIDIIEKK